MVKIFLNMELLYLIMVIKGEPRLVVLKSVNDSRVEISSIVVTTQGDNLTLICEFRNRGLISFVDATAWRKVYRLKFIDGSILSEKVTSKALDLQIPSQLSFAPVTLHNQGIYFCTSFRHNLTKLVYITVKSQLPDLVQNNRRVKRAEYNTTHRPERNNSRVATKRVKFKGRHNSSINSEYNLDRSYYKTENSKTLVNSFGPLLYIVAIAALSLVIFILYIVYQQAKHAEDEVVSTTCTHPICIRLRQSNPSHGCILETIISNHRTNERIVSVSNFINPLMSLSSDRNNYLDLPPSYFASVNSDSPPSYEQAVATVSGEFQDASDSPLTPSDNQTN